MFTTIIAGGWDYGDTTGFIAWLAIIGLVMITLLPLASISGYYQHGWFAYVQLPIIICVLASIAILFVHRGSRRPMLKLVGIYIALCLGTNIWAFASRIDHSRDFPVTDRLMALTKAETVQGVVKVFGTPIQDSVMAISTRPIPRIVHRVLEDAKMESAHVLRYEEESEWGDCTICFLVFDPKTEQLITVARHYARPGRDRTLALYEPF